MEYRELGQTGIIVSLLGLGTMTWGEQNTEQEAHLQLDAAIDAGINFIDTAELYPVPPRAATMGRTEAILGRWLQQRKGTRDDLIIATKVCGRAEWLPYVRDGKACLNKAQINQAIDASLKKLGLDYIDLYQLHWPDRRTNFFGQLGYYPSADDDRTPIEETLEVVAELVTAGKVRHIGISNETPWGVMEYLRLAKKKNWPRIASIQNPYNLLNRSFEVGLAEIVWREQVGLIAYSPLAFGTLSGKYVQNARPPGARITLFDHFARYTNPAGVAATEQYVDLAQSFDIDPCHLALAYINSRPYVTSTLIGATSIKQLECLLKCVEITLPKDLVKGIETIHKAHPNPCP